MSLLSIQHTPSTNDVLDRDEQVPIRAVQYQSHQWTTDIAPPFVTITLLNVSHAVLHTILYYVLKYNPD